MPDYKQLYHRLFNAITDALEDLEQEDIPRACFRLKKSQQDTEELYLKSYEVSSPETEPAALPQGKHTG